MNGIYVEATVSGGFWSETKDPIYLGIYGKNGGREFALQVDGASPFTQEGSTVKLILGVPCCKKVGTQVDKSTGLNENDPSLNPMSLEDIEFVYFRKYGGKTGHTDDWAEFSNVTVLFCDSDDQLLRYKKKGRMHFAKEAGLQHWLERDPTVPRCKVTVKLRNIHHIETANNSAGHNWQLRWHIIVPPFSSVDSYSARINPSNENEEWNQLLDRSYSFEIEGCCGPIPVIIMCMSREHDFFTFDDIGAGSNHTVVDCSVGNNAVPLEVQTDVHGENNNNRSRLTYFFEITTECLD